MAATVSESKQGDLTLVGIAGNLDQNDVDLFKISICDAANFGATTVGGANWDTMLWVFDTTGAGVVAEDDASGTVQSTITGQFIPGNGDFYLGISGYGRFATDASQQTIWNSYVPEQRPNGPGAGNPLAGWTDGGGGGAYTIFLRGSCYLGAVSHCYANCDGSTGAGFLNINDFVCFQSAFAAGGSYANCDGSTGPGNLNINDFVCFQSAFAAGCSAP